MVFGIFTSRDLWRTVHKQTGLRSGRFMVQGTYQFRCQTRKGLAFFIGPNPWKSIQRRTLGETCKINIVSYASSTKMQHQYQKLKNDTLLSERGGCHQALQLRKGSDDWISGFRFGTFVIASGEGSCTS